MLEFPFIGCKLNKRDFVRVLIIVMCILALEVFLSRRVFL